MSVTISYCVPIDAGVHRRLRKLGGTMRACSWPTRTGALWRRTLPPNLRRRTSRFVALPYTSQVEMETRLDPHTPTEVNKKMTGDQSVGGEIFSVGGLCTRADDVGCVNELV